MEPYIFYTHYDYERIFRVEVDGSNIRIFKNIWEVLNKNENHCIFELKAFQNIYLGVQPNDIYDSFHHGNTLVIKVTDDKYIFIGEIIYAFELKEEIVYYSSRVIKGQPFPYFLTKDKCYLLLDNVYIKNDYEGDPYEWYYDNPEKAENFRSILICDNYIFLNK